MIGIGVAGVMGFVDDQQVKSRRRIAICEPFGPAHAPAAIAVSVQGDLGKEGIGKDCACIAFGPFPI
jgi:hypothetical protein